MTTIFKIRRKSDGLFSTGGTSPSFNAKGKVWKARNHVTSHMKQIGYQYYNPKTKDDYYRDCEVVEYEVVETEVSAVPALDWKESPKTLRAKQLQQERRIQYELERASVRKKQLEAELAELNKKIG